MNHRTSVLRNASAFIALVLLVALSAVSFLPLVETNVWWVRLLDFPRLQFALVTIVLIVLYSFLQRHPGQFGWLAIFGAVVALGYHAYKLHPYTTLVATAVTIQSDCPEGRAVRVMIANVKRRNESAEIFLAQVAAAEPDLLLVMETDAWWAKRLSILDKEFRHRIHVIPDGHAFYGMHLYSRLELISPEFRFFFGADTPTAVAQVRLPEGEIIGFIGLHPRPPLAFLQPSTMRDAHVLQGALIAREWEVPTVLAGDFNAVPWERVTRRAVRIGGLLDPRIGRGLFPTYDTESFLISWPLDQILFQPQFTLHDFRTLPDFGSDHLAVVMTVCHDLTAAQRAPETLPNDLVEANASFEAARNLTSTSAE